MQAEKSHNNMLSASWRTKEAGGIVQVWVCRPENPGSLWCNSVWEWRPTILNIWGLRLAKDKCHRSGRETTCPSSAFLLYLEDCVWMIVAHIWEDNFFVFSLLIALLISSGTTVIGRPRNNALPATWVSLNLLKLTPKI